MKKKVFKNGTRKKIVSLMLASSMLVTSLGNSGAELTAFAETTEDTAKDVASTMDVSTTVQEDCNSEIYDHIEDYPTGALLEPSEEVTDEVISNVDEYYKEIGSVEANSKDTSYPSAVDLSQSEYVPNIAMQIGGSCTLYAGIYYLGTYAINKARGISSKTAGNTLSPLFVYNRTRGSESTGTGTALSDAAKFLLNNGAPYQSVAPSTTSVSNYKYTWYPTEKIWEAAANNRVDSVNFIQTVPRYGTPITSPDDSDLDLMKAMINNGQMILYATHFRTFNYTKTEPTSVSHPNEDIVSRCDYYYSNADGSRYLGGHAMVIVGYDDNIWVDINHDGVKQTAEVGAIKVVNSHGTGYKENGYVWVAYDALNKVSAVLTSADETRINAAIDAGTIVDGKVSSKDRCAFLPGNYGSEVVYTCTSQKSTSDTFLVASVKTADRVDLVLKINAKNKSTGKTYSYDTDYNLRYRATDTDSWPTNFALDGSTKETEGTIAFDLNRVISNITLDTLDDYEWSVSMYDRDTASNPVTITDLSIKSNGMVLYTSGLSNKVLTGTSTTYALSESHALLKGFDWDYTENETSVSSYRKLTAVAATTDSLTYKFTVTDASGTVTTLKDYSTTNYVNWNPSATGNYTLAVYAKNSVGNVDIMKKKVKINSEPKIAKVSFDQNFPRTVGSTITANITYEGGTGSVNCAMYVRGGNYPYTSHTIYFTNVSNTQKTWVPDMDGTYKLYASITDASGCSNFQVLGTYEVVANNQVTIYYKNSGWSQAYVHYMVDGQGWTTVPGVKMSSSSTAANAGYTWKATIDLGSASKVTLCFNDNNGNWDNNNRQNYVLNEPGIYGIKDTKVTKIDNTTATPTVKPTATSTVKPTATPTVRPTNTPTAAPVEETTFYYDNSKTKWSNVYVYAWADGVSAKMFTGSKVTSNIYKFTVSNTYTKVLFKNVNSTSTWDKQTADAGAPQAGKVFTPSSGSNKTSGTWKEYNTATATPTNTPVVTATPTVAPANYISINYDNSKTNWSSVYAYVWVEGDSSVTPVIVKSTASGNNVYSFRVADTYKNILFKNTDGIDSWNQQTADTTLPSSSGYTFVTNSGANKTGGYWTKTPVTTASPTPIVTATPTVKPTNTPAPGNTVTFYFDNSKTNWSNVYVYAWGGETTSAIKGTSLGNNIYTFTISKNYQKVLFKNTAGTSSWDKQTADVGAPLEGKIFTPSSASNKTSGTWKETTAFVATYLLTKCLNLEYVNSLISE